MQWMRSGPRASTAIAAHNARVDSPRKAHDDTGKTILIHIIAKAEDTGGVIGFVALLDVATRSLDTNKSLCSTLPNRLRDHGRKSWKLERARAIGIEAEGRAIEDKLVLAAALIEINERQFALGNTRGCDRKPLVCLAAPVRRTVGNKKNFAACGGEACDRVRAPNILADRNADAHALEGD